MGKKAKTPRVDVTFSLQEGEAILEVLGKPVFRSVYDDARKKLLAAVDRCRNAERMGLTHAGTDECKAFAKQLTDHP